MRRIAMLASIGAALLGAAALAADGPVKQYQTVTLGFYRGQVISYLDFGPSNWRGATPSPDLGRDERCRGPAEHRRHRPRPEVVTRRSGRCGW